MTEKALVGGDAHLGAFNLAISRLASQLPGELADLGARLGRDRLAEAAEAARRVDRDAAADLGRAVAREDDGARGLLSDGLLGDMGGAEHAEGEARQSQAPLTLEVDDADPEFYVVKKFKDKMVGLTNRQLKL